MLNFNLVVFISLLISLHLQVQCKQNEVSQPLLCFGCVAVVSEIHKTIPPNSFGRKSVVDKVLDGLCIPDYFVVYKFSPPKMTKACKFILDKYRAELLESSVKFYKKFNTINNDILKEEFCVSKIKACETIPQNGEEQLPTEGQSEDEINEKLSQAVNRAQLNKPEL